MKIVVIGGTGLIGTKLVNNLRERGHEVLAASPKSGVNTFTGEGLAEALAGAQVVVDLANAPSWEDKAVLEFFETARRTAPRCAVNRRRRSSSGERLFAREGGAGKRDQGIQGSIYDRSLDAVLRIRKRHRAISHRRANGPVVAWYDATHRRRRRRRRPDRCRTCQASEWHGRDCRS